MITVNADKTPQPSAGQGAEAPIEELRQSEKRYRILVDHVPLPIFVHARGRFAFVNPAAVRLHGARRAEDLIGRELLRFVHPEDQKRFQQLRQEAGASGPVSMDIPLRLLRTDGTEVSVEVTAISIQYDGQPARLVICRDVSRHQHMQAALEKSQLALTEKTNRLEEVNRALKVMLDHREVEKRAIEQNIVSWINKFVQPYLERLTAMPLTNEARTYLDIVQANLKDLLTPLAQHRSARYAELTPTEVDVAELIRQGLSSKEIASRLNVSPSAVAFHRTNIRKKFGILHKKKNLRSYLGALAG